MGNKYSKLSNFEINKLIVEKLLNTNSIFIWTGNRYIRHQKIEKKNSDNCSVLVEYKFLSRSIPQVINFCFDQSQAMPLMIENKISLRYINLNGKWEAIGGIYSDRLTGKSINTTSVNENPCRAIAECYLLIKDAENG